PVGLTLLPYPTLFRSVDPVVVEVGLLGQEGRGLDHASGGPDDVACLTLVAGDHEDLSRLLIVGEEGVDGQHGSEAGLPVPSGQGARKSTRLNSSHVKS